MGLIKAAAGSIGGVLADQWKEYFYCDALEADILAAKGQKRASRRSSNTKSSDNIITNGSIIAVADGQCMMIVEQGKVVEVCAEPGEFTYDSSTEPSVFAGSLGSSIGEVFKNIGKRFTFGGEPPKDQRVYYFNTKELIGNKYGTPSPVPFRVVDTNIGLDMDISVRCFGEYSFHISNPLLFYTNVCGNVDDIYPRTKIEGQLKAELLTALQPAFARISEMGIRYSSLPGHTAELAEALNTELSAKWRDLRGLEIVSMGVSSVKADEKDEAMIKELQRNAALRDPSMAAAHLTGAQAAAMQAAASNQGSGAAMAFMGMNMAQNAAGSNIQELFNMGQAGRPAHGLDQVNRAKGYGTGMPGQTNGTAAKSSWTCTCGEVNTGRFCSNCGNPRPQDNSWTCDCGEVNTGKFCSNCGRPRPDRISCSRCGWTAKDAANPPRFCPNCGNKL